MTTPEAVKRQRLFVVWIATVAICATVVLVDVLMHPVHIHLLGLHVSNGLTGTAYIAATVMCLTTFRWFRTAPDERLGIKDPPGTTVRDLRQRGSHRA